MDKQNMNTTQGAMQGEPFQLDFSYDEIANALKAVSYQDSKHNSSPYKININPETVEHDLARLVLTLIEFLRRLMELQAIRRMENGSLSTRQEDDLGTTLFRARCQVEKLAEQFGLSPEDLTLDLGPLGKIN